MDFSAYEKGNPFMSYNHIQICKVDPDCCVVKVKLGCRIYESSWTRTWRIVICNGRLRGGNFCQNGW